MTEDRRAAALAVIGDMLSPQTALALEHSATSGIFGADIGVLAVDNVFGSLWTRPGLDRRTRSLVTIGMLIALRATEELAIHVPAAVRNGATVAEIEEVIYQATGYAGFPAASSARRIAEEALKGSGEA